MLCLDILVFVSYGRKMGCVFPYLSSVGILNNVLSSVEVLVASSVEVLVALMRSWLGSWMGYDYARRLVIVVYGLCSGMLLQYWLQQKGL